MNASAALLVLAIIISFFIVIIDCILLLIFGIKNKDSKKVKRAGKVLGVWFIVVCLILGIPLLLFGPMLPQLKVRNNQVTILNEGSGSMGSYATYDLSKDGIIEEIAEPEYRHWGATKFGYRFESLAAGETYILISEYDCGELAYADVYDVTVKENNEIEASHIENIDMDSYTTEQDLMEYVSERYGFKFQE